MTTREIQCHLKTIAVHQTYDIARKLRFLPVKIWTLRHAQETSCCTFLTLQNSTCCNFIPNISSAKGCLNYNTQRIQNVPSYVNQDLFAVDLKGVPQSIRANRD
mmetsp:Transcript_4651/g.9086  ORF Transcript_4651/g.9086 Transcript_4651/m.9086 type:complete len:104 (+) Transcript_4651:1262-1573(+)